MKKTAIGILILLAGVILLLKNLGFFDWSFYRIFFSWQMLLIAIGVIMLFDKNGKNKNAGGILILIGVIFLIPRIFSISIGHILFPALLIILGIYFILRTSTNRNRASYRSQSDTVYADFSEIPYEESAMGDLEVIKREFVFSGAKERWSYGKIKSIEIDAIFSGVEIDMIDVNLAPEVEKVHIKVSSVFSGVTLYVPDNWNIIIQKTGIFGDFTDKRAPHSLPHGGKLVVLELEAVFSGGEIKYYE